MKNFILPWKQYALWLFALNFFTLINAQTTIYSENFSSGAGGWTDTSTGAGTGDWVIGSNVDHATGATGNYYYSQQYSTNYNNNTYIIATSPAIDMTGFAAISLSFDLWIDTEATFDGVKLEYSLNNGSSWNDLGSVATTGWYNDTDVDAFANGEDGFSGSSGDAWVSYSINLSNEDIGFEAASQARVRILMASDNSVTDRGAAFDEILIEGTASAPSPEIAITGLGNTINDGDSTPSITDDTEFGDIDITAGTDTHTFTIRNVGALPLSLTGASPYVVISGAHAADFILSSTPTNNINSGGSSTFQITFNPSALGTRSATISIANNDSDENPYNFAIQGNGIDLCASTITSFPYNEGFESGLGLITQDSSDDFNWTRNTGATPSGSTGPNTAASGSWYLYTEASNGNTNNTSNLETPCFDLSGLTIPEFSFNYHMYGAEMGTLNIDISTDGGITYPTNLWTQTGQVQTSDGQAWNNVTISLAAYTGQTIKIRIQGITGSTYRSDMAIDDLYLGEVAAPSPEIEVRGLGVNIVNGDLTPDVSDDTDFGSIDIGSPSTNTYTINNLGSLPLTVGTITIVGANAAEFIVSSTPTGTLAAGASTSFDITFTPTGLGVRSASLSFSNNDTDENPFDFSIQGNGQTPLPNYTYYCENFDISDGGWSVITSTNDTWIWTNAFPSNELGDGSFWRNTNFDNYSNNTNIVIESPSLDFSGLQNLRLSLDYKCKTESTSDGLRILYSIGGGAYTLLGSSAVGTNWYGGTVTAFGTEGWSGDTHTPEPAFNPHNQFIKGSLRLSDATFAGQNNVRFRIEFSTGGSGVDDGVGFDNFLIEADGTTTPSDPTTGPADVTSNLRLWLKANQGISVADGAALTSWEDQAYVNSFDQESASATNSTAPIYRDNSTRNINYNPVVDFDNNSVQFMQGKGGFFSEDYFAVVRSDDLVDTQTGNFSPGRQFAIGARYGGDSFHEDPTGLGLGSTSSRYPDEILSHNVNSFPNNPTSPPNDNSYGRAYTSSTDAFNHVLIVNVKSNAARTQTEIYKNGKRLDNTTGTAGNGADLNFKEFGNAQYILGAGRSGLSGRTTSQLNGMLGEIVSYDTPNSNLNQQKIYTYLGLKYGVTLQASNSTATTYRENDVDYIDSNGDVVWDTSANTGFNFDVAGIGRDDGSVLNQKQSLSQNLESDGIGPTSGFLTMALTQVYDTNNENISLNGNSLDDREFLVWGNNNASLDGAPNNVNVDMSAGISGAGAPVTEVSFTSIPRIWKVVETGGDVSTVQVRIPTNIVRTATPPNGRYLMFISSTGVFDPTAQYRVMNENGGFLYADYDFNGTEYITFGWAPELEFNRSIYFDPSNTDFVDVGDNLDLSPSGFSISAWFKRDAADTGIKSILSKRDAAFTEGYDLNIWDNNRIQFRWRNGTFSNLVTNTQIPDDEWHHIAVTHDGSILRMYIDGVLDNQASRTIPNDNSASFLIGAAGKLSTTQYFRGNIDEVRIWNTALSESQLRVIMNQEIEDNSNFVGGSYFIDRGIIPTKEEINTIPWSDLAGYYPMSIYTYTNTRDESGNGNIGALRNLTTVDWQTAPLPYMSNSNGDWEDNSTWVNGDVQATPGTTSIVDSSVSVDWNIVRTTHNITIDNDSDLPSGNDGNRSLLGLFVDSNELTLEGDTSSNTGFGLTVTHYLNLDGNIDLNGESQLIQTEDSDLEVNSAGLLERDQQGTADVYTYNYWAAPVGETSTTSNNTSYTLPAIFKDGTNENSPAIINFITSSYDGTNTTPIGIADYWIWKFANQADDDYSAWQHVRSTGTLLPGEGFTMKGPGSGAVLDDQNYIYQGKPNNGDINLVLNANNDYLVGNPYPSAIDAHQFIIDNATTIEGPGPTTGTLYFWEHWGGGSHNLSEYLGGYATYNLSGGTPSAAMGTNDPDVGTGGTPTKTPGRYIPVGQGFFVVGETTGNINFNNGQRVFRRESASSVFMSPNPNLDERDGRSSNSFNYNQYNSDADTRLKIRLGFNSASTIRRQLLITADDYATPSIDPAFDGALYETQIDDAYWLIEGEKYTIQGTNIIDDNTILPLGIHLEEDGNNSFVLDEIMNNTDGLEVYIHDKDLDVYHNLSLDGAYNFFANTGTHLERFEIVFNYGSLSTDEFEMSGFEVYYSNTTDQMILMNPNYKEITSIEMINLLGQSIVKFNDIELTDYAEFNVNDISVGAYIIKVTTLSGNYSKKVLVD